MEDVAGNDGRTIERTRISKEQIEVAEGIFWYFNALMDMRAKVVAGRLNEKEKAAAGQEVLDIAMNLSEKLQDKQEMLLPFVKLFFMCVETQVNVNYLSSFGLHLAAKLQLESAGVMEGVLISIAEEMLGKKIDTTALELAANAVDARAGGNVNRVILATR